MPEQNELVFLLTGFLKQEGLNISFVELIVITVLVRDIL